MRTITAFLTAAAAAVLLSASAQAQVTLRASHQFPGGKHDVRDDMVQMIAKEVSDANVGITVQVYPGASLFKPNQQWNAMADGQLDISLFPLDYASGKMPAFSATLMPGLIRSQDRAKRINNSRIHEGRARRDREARRDRAVRCLVCRRHGRERQVHQGSQGHGGPEIPRRRSDLRRHVAGGRRQHRQPAVERNLQRVPDRRRRRGTDTSLGTFASTRLYEVTKCLTAPGNNALWFMYEPVLMSKKNFEKLNKQQQDAIIKAGKDAQAYYEKKADEVNEEAIKAFKDHKVEGRHAFATPNTKPGSISPRRAPTPNSPRTCRTARS